MVKYVTMNIFYRMTTKQRKSSKEISKNYKYEKINNCTVRDDKNTR